MAYKTLMLLQFNKQSSKLCCIKVLIWVSLLNIDIVNKLLVILLPVLFNQYVKSMVILSNPPLKDTSNTFNKTSNRVVIYWQ